MAQPYIPRTAMLAAVLARAIPAAHPGAIARTIGAMVLAAKWHQRDALAQCNGSRSEVAQRREDLRLQRLTNEAAAELARCGAPWNDHQRLFHVTGTDRSMTLLFGGDPQGACGYLTINDMPGDGPDAAWAIYE
jgi:hypothetical protein